MPGSLKVASLHRRAREEALVRLRREPRLNLFLIDLVHQLDAHGAAGEPRAEVLVVTRDARIVGVASRRPTVAIDATVEPDALAALVARLADTPGGLVRGPVELAAPLWDRLAARGRRALVDRTEAALLVGPSELRPAPPAPDARLRRARAGDLDTLVETARASLREEGRCDPSEADPRGFRHWVSSRLDRALVVEADGEVAFVGYADVRLPEGWLLQGVYTRPGWRGRGFAAAGVSALCAEAFARGTEHVQLSVVEGNQPALELYRKLGFRRFATLRTLLFA